MALPANSQVVIDLSGDNDNAGPLTSSSIPSTDAGFERSCDNPKCSAPKLISLVPKRETSEFITDPVIMNTPTLINGFTTVFQIDGIGARMNEIMYGDNSDPNSMNGGPSKPKSVFRIVPNTHAHIVNYVVVDGAGETMRKIKASDPETMRKLMDSQRQSAEQMLKKIIGKAFKPPLRQSEASVPQPSTLKVPELVTPQPILTKPVSSVASNAAPMVRDNPVSTQSISLPAVPPGITITQLPMSEELHTLKTPPVAITGIAPKQIVVSKTSTSSLTPIPLSSAPVLRNALVTPPAQNTKNLLRPTTLKRKLVTTPIPDAVKRLRPRSPKQKTPMAIGLLPLDPKKSVNKLNSYFNLPTKLPTNPAAKSTFTVQKPPEKEVPSPKINLINPPIQEMKKSNTAPELLPPKEKETILPSSVKATAPSSLPPPTAKVVLTESHETDTSQMKPIFGPASKMDASKTLTASRASVHGSKSNVGSETLLPKHLVGKIGETVITSTSGKATKLLSITKPCTVSIQKVDVPITKKDCESVNIVTASQTITAGTKTNTIVSSNATPGHQSSKLIDKDPLSLDIDKQDITPTPSIVTTNTPKSVPSTRTTAAMKSIEASPPAILKLQPKPPTLNMATRKTESALPTKQSPLPTKSHPLLPTKITRSSTPKVTTSLPKLPTLATRQPRVPTPTTKSPSASLTPLVITETSSAQQSKVLRVVLPTIKKKSGVMTIPTKPVHPNLKISSVTSGGNIFDEKFPDDSNQSSPSANEDDSGANIEKLQQELADLRRTVARLSKKKQEARDAFK